MAEFESCDKCRYSSKSENEYPCNKCVHSATDKFEPKTNADKIRAMSDEELAEWLTRITDDAQLDAKTKCNYQWADWLQSEAE